MARKKRHDDPKADLFDQWNEYFGQGDLDDWRRLCGDLVFVNIKQFLKTQRRPDEVLFFENEQQLAKYCQKKGRKVRNDGVPKGSPLRVLLRQINKHHHWSDKFHDSQEQGSRLKKEGQV
ncbi:hypothetical protein EsH8_I_000917 [Colletotrichum jinshuiense]